MGFTQYRFISDEREIIKYFLAKDATAPSRTISKSELIKDDVNVLSPGFAQLRYFGILLEKGKDNFYLSVKNLKQYQKYMFLHMFSYSSVAVVFILLALMLFLNEFNIMLLVYALALSFIIFLPPAIIAYRNYSIKRILKEIGQRKTEESSEETSIEKAES